MYNLSQVLKNYQALQELVGNGEYEKAKEGAKVVLDEIKSALSNVSADQIIAQIGQGISVQGLAVDFEEFITDEKIDEVDKAVNAAINSDIQKVKIALSILTKIVAMGLATI